MKGGAWLVLAVSMLMGLGLTIGAIASRRQMRTAVVVVLCLVGIGIVLAGAALASASAFCERVKPNRKHRRPTGLRCFFEPVKKCYFLTKGGGLTAAHALSAGGGRRARLQAEKYFLRRTCRRRK